ncbi:MAG: hypothetical protein WCS09_18715 [Pseudomonadota bacterium]|jgi:hypothetical protein
MRNEQVYAQLILRLAAMLARAIRQPAFSAAGGGVARSKQWKTGPLIFLRQANKGRF